MNNKTVRKRVVPVRLPPMIVRCVPFVDVARASTIFYRFMYSIYLFDTIRIMISPLTHSLTHTHTASCAAKVQRKEDEAAAHTGLGDERCLCTSSAGFLLNVMCCAECLRALLVDTWLKWWWRTGDLVFPFDCYLITDIYAFCLHANGKNEKKPSVCVCVIVGMFEFKTVEKKMQTNETDFSMSSLFVFFRRSSFCSHGTVGRTIFARSVMVVSVHACIACVGISR